MDDTNDPNITQTTESTESRAAALIGGITDLIDSMGFKKSNAKDMVEVGVALGTGFVTLVAHLRDQGERGRLEMFVGADILLKSHYGMMEALKSKGDNHTYVDSVGEASRNLKL